ncbi:hypothetical protein P3G55_26630, partial [Leptospira sp. 96542]|nr:hypothetical protein [Leptospira sp. 96542]
MTTMTHPTPQGSATPDELSYDPAHPTPYRWGDLFFSALVSVALIVLMLLLNLSVIFPASAQGAAVELRIGFQKSASLLTLQKAQGSLEKKLAPLGASVKWVEFPAIAGRRVATAMPNLSVDSDTLRQGAGHLHVNHHAVRGARIQSG